jgi:hypothetical protein
MEINGRSVGVEDGRTTESIDLALGLRMAAGARAEVDASGIVMLSGEVVLDPLICYFFYATKDATTIDAYRFHIFEAPVDATADVRIDPANPSAARITVTTNEPQRTNFRTRYGGVVTLTLADGAYVYQDDPATGGIYLSLDGYWQWGLDGGAPSEIDMIMAFSGSEYVQAPPAWYAHFVSGSPAFAQFYRADGSSVAANAFPLVPMVPGGSAPATTAWFYVMATAVPGPSSLSGSDAASYFSQPDLAGLFRPDENDSFLQPLLLPAATLPSDENGAFPTAPYAGVEMGSDPVAFDTALRRFEVEVLAAARAQTIYQLDLSGALFGDAPLCMSGPTGITGPTGPVENAVTPQGLLSFFNTDPVTQSLLWSEMVLAQTNGGTQRLVLTDIDGALRAALLANHLFLVISSPDRLKQYASTRFCITDQVLSEAAAAKVPDGAIYGASQLLGVVYHSVEYFCPALATALGSYFEEWGPWFIAASELAQITIADWTFDLSTSKWKDPNASTILIIKFADGDVESLVRDRSRWTMPSTFNDGDGVPAQTALIQIIENAKNDLPNTPELQYFVQTVLASRQTDGTDVWNGVLFLNPAVPTNSFPPDLQALAAGLPKGDLRGHHLGVTLTSFDVWSSSITIADSALFGLILYSDPQDLAYQGEPYDFKVLSLKVLFANSTIASFSSEVELLVAELFGELANIIGSLNGNNIILDGTLQEGVYRFATTTESRFTMTSFVLDAVTVTTAQFVTLTDESTADHTVARFILNGTMTFRKLDFDLFGFGPNGVQPEPANDGMLRFSNLFISMDFNPNDPEATRAFAFQAGQMNFDPSGSRARPGSLPRRFPLQAAAMLQSESMVDPKTGRTRLTKPADFGFIPVESPLKAGTLGNVWFGLQMTLNFGSPGALAPKLGFTGALLASWAPSANGYNVAIGIRLPGSDSGKKSLTIMGPLKLNIGRLNFMYDDLSEGYLLRLQNVALSFLGLSFPPGGQSNATLFGDPDPQSTNSSLGWYLAYKKDEKKKEEKKPQALLPPANE